MKQKIRFSVCLLWLLMSSISVSAHVGNDWINILDEGGNNRGEKCTKAVQGALNKANGQGGGTVYFPAGEYLTGAITLKSNTTIHLDAGAVLKFSDDFDDYLPFVQMRWEGIVMKSFSPLIYANGAENIAIVGRGKIDGQGKKWWDAMYSQKTGEDKGSLKKYQELWRDQNQGLDTEPYFQGNIDRAFFRPPLIQFFKCDIIRIEGITIENSPFWTVNPAFCNNVTITGVTIFNPPSPNTDGINPTSCKNVHISDCHISVGDDCITIKSGRDGDGRKWATPTENVTITNCTMLSGHGGVVIGSEMSGGIKKITISNCVFDGTDRGIRLKAARGRGGVVEEIRVNNIVMKDIKIAAVVMNLFYDKGTQKEPVTERTPTFRNIHISNVTATGVKKAGLILGIAEMPIENISLSNINIEAEEGLTVDTVENMEIHDVKINTAKGASFDIANAKNLVFDNVKTDKPLTNAPVIRVKNVSNMLIHNNFPMQMTDTFLEVKGRETKDIFLQNNVFSNVEKVVKKGAELRSDAIMEKKD